jgi:ribosomal protein S18 acetylase RimI-like enzyme
MPDVKRSLEDLRTLSETSPPTPSFRAKNDSPLSSGTPWMSPTLTVVYMSSGAVSSIMGMIIRQFQPQDEDAVVYLWKLCGLTRPSNDPHKDIRRKLRVRPDLFLVGVLDGKIVACEMAGYEGHRGWLNYWAVHASHQREGLGRRIVTEAEDRLRASGCPKVNLQVRTSNRAAISFYERIGYSIDDVVSMGKRLQTDQPST